MRRTALCTAAGLLLVALAIAAPRPLAAQAAPAAGTQVGGGGVAKYLVNNPRVLNLDAKQVERVRKIVSWVDSVDAPLRAQWQQVTGGRAVRAMDPAERRRLAPQLQPILRQLQANNEMTLDSIDALLTPEQQTRLESLRQEYMDRMRARRMRANPRP
jgi:hypothetical protein